MRFTRFFAALLVAAPIAAASAQSAPALASGGSTTYAIDPVHSEMSFRVRHLVGRVAGTFSDWSGTVVLDSAGFAGGTGAVNVVVKTKSIHTLQEQRDAHLRTPDFFAADSFPEMTYKSNRVVRTGDAISVHGTLTLRGKTKPVILTGKFRGRTMDPWGKERISFEAGTTINRQDFGVSFNQFVEGASVIGDDVEIAIVIEAVRQ
ncbi:MAG: YceI family protein [Gemmatimonadaceae bacterium]